MRGGSTTVGSPSAGARFMLKEIREAPSAAARLLEREGARIRTLGARLRRRRPAGILMAARGSSDNAALYGKYLLETRLGVPVTLAAPSIITLLGGRLRLRRYVAVGISQSGQSTDIVAFLEAARARGALTVAITNQPRSSLARVAHEVVLTHAGDERSVAATKTYLNQLIAFTMLGAEWAGDRRLSRDAAAIPEAQRAVLAQDGDIAGIAERYRYMRECIVAARGYDFATAKELALKLMETCYVVALPLSSADLLHGPIALVEPDFPVFLIASPGPVLAHLADVASRLRARRAETVIFSSEETVLRLASVPIRVAARAEGALAPPIYGVAIQLLACHLSQAKGIDPDHPRGLRKVTRTL
ncbi:MAG: SIS domain-containing protein [Bacillati bacterium ANGP1]|uniref:SIS domain-containing protein n=1 Tax=Candidatus Segetimicrobium genomatis TaxID=2569760 RepID=A0A537J4E0_9BACT|nr:MAG: SIS domain-containing protein [Terrabacteria group bacterium ANGP1]